MDPLLFYSWAAFWLTYLIGGCLLYDDADAVLLPNTVVSHKLLFRTVGLNALFSFLFIPIASLIPTLIVVPDSLYGFAIHVLLSLLIGDAIFYSTHRLMHHPWFYKYHKLHHNFSKPHMFAGVYAHPVEFIISNHLAMMIPFKLVQIHHPWWIIIESIVVSTNILKSHSGYESIWTGSPIHNLHHDKMNCNYGFLYIHDLMFGTLRLS